MPQPSLWRGVQAGVGLFSRDRKSEEARGSELGDIRVAQNIQDIGLDAAPAPAKRQGIFQRLSNSISRRRSLAHEVQAAPPRDAAADVARRDPRSRQRSQEKRSRPRPDVKPGAIVLKRLDQKTKWTRHPGERSVQKWNLVILGLLLIEAVVLPLQLAFVPEKGSNRNFWLTAYRRWVEGALWLDMGIQFFIQVELGDSWVTEIRPVALEYLKHGFFVDLFSLLPLRQVALEDHWDWAGLHALGENHKEAPCSVAMLGFNKLLRFFRLWRVLHVLTEHSPFFVFLAQLTHSQTTLLKTFLTIIFAAHCIGCMWATLAVCGAEEYTWYEYIRADKPGDGFMYAEDDGWSLYMCSLYWAIFTITGIGYGDIIPVSTMEYFAATCAMCTGSLTWAWVVANIVSIIAVMGEGKTCHLQTLDCVNAITEMKHMKASRLAPRLREYFTKLQNVRDDSFAGKLIDQLSPELKMEVVYAVHGHWLEKVWWLKRIPIRTEFMVDLTRSMQPALHIPNEMIPTTMQLTIIRQGLCIHGGRLLGRGQIYGEDMLLDSEKLRKPWTTLALTYLHILIVRKSVFKAILEKHPDAQPHLRKAQVIFIVFRGVQRQAEKLRKARLKESCNFTGSLFKLTRMDSLRVVHSEHDEPDSPLLADAPPDPPGQPETFGEEIVKADLDLLGRVGMAEASLRTRMTALELAAQKLVEQAKLLSAV